MKILSFVFKNPKLFIKKIFGGIPKYYRIHVLKDNFTINMKQWFIDKGDATLRLDYPSLNKNSVVFDIGGYQGDFANSIHTKYGCKVYLFEPHPKFYKKSALRFKDNQKIITFNYGLSNKNGIFELTDDDDGSSFMNEKKNTTIICEIRDIIDVFNELNIQNIDLMKINIEGGEYPLLQHIAENGNLDIIDNYQIQFHNFIENAPRKREEIISALKKTHHNNWCYEFVWENWRRK